MRILIILSLALSALAYGWIHQEINVSPNYSSKNSCSAISTKNTELSETQFLSSTQLNFVCDRKSDSLELVKFYNAMGGPNWTVRWDLNKSMSTWFGITLDFDGCVMWINFENGINQCCIGNNLKGSLYQINLPNLNFMDLADNQIEGSIPNFNFLPMLVDLTLFNNKISGAIPNFNKLPNLKFLLLFANKLSGMIPEFEKSPDLLYIDVNYNNLSGLIPRFENHLKDLDILNYSINNFTFNSLISNNQANKLLVTLNNKLCPGCDGDTLEYAPQFNVYYDTSILIQNNTPYTLDLLIDDTVTTSIYTWYKNGILYKNIKGSNKLPFTPFTSADAGTYTVKITNPLAPQLTLESWPIRLNAGPSLVCDRRSDSLELVKFYNATGGPNWTIKWDLSKAMNTWYGISLSTEGCVQKIDFKGISNNLSGILIQLNLSQLTLLDLGWNQLTGSIPNFDKLPNLRYLALSRNQLTGSIPNFDKLPNLESLNLVVNKLTGATPNFDKLSNLKSLDLSNNQLTGSIPNFDKLPNLGFLNLNVNKLTGSIPNFDKLLNLQYLGLDFNKLIGSIPNFDKLPNLQSLSLGWNQLIGSIPNFDKLPNLQSLILIENQLTGSIPNFDKLPNLRYLALSRNQLTGSIPNFDKLSNLLELDLFDNQLTGILPDHTLTNPKLNRYWIYQNKLTFSSFIRNIKKVKNLTDVLNKGFFSNDTLIYAPQKMIYVDTSIYIPINASYTLDLLIDDTVTTSTYTWYKNGILYKTIKGSNKLTFNPFTTTDAGTYTVMITNPLAPQLTLESWPIRLNAGPSLVCDRRSDSLELKKFYDSTGGANWFTKWNLSEPMDKWWGIKLSPTGCVTEINMRESRPNNCCDGNNLNGSLPDLNLSALELLHCQNNTSLKGQIPNFNLPNLMEMSLPTCSLSGPIPIFDKLPKLKILNLNRNNLSDTLPDFKNLNNLEVLNLGTNSISGKIPDFPSFQKLINLELYSNLLTGPIPNFSSLNNLNLLYLQSNQLSGTIPNFTNLRSLMFLGLDNNKLTGHLPSFEFSKNLKVVGITNNLLNGLFPNYSGFTPALTSMTIDRNCYTFSGLAINIVKTQELTQKNVLPGCQCPDSLVYHPQKKIYVDTTITIPSCTDYTLDLKIDDTVTSSIYSWFKDGVPFNTRKGSNKLPFIGFNSTNAGTYTVKITNPFAPQLTLESHPIRLISSGTAPQINNPRDTALSCGSFYILPTLKGINLTGNGLYFSGPGKSGMSYKPGDKIISTTTLYAFDGSGSCFDEDTFTISFSIKPAFILKPDQYKVPYNQSILFDVLANDFIPPGLNVMVVIDNPVHGKSFYSQTLGKGTYTPDLGYIGKEILKYKVCPVSCPNVCDSSTVEFDVLPPCSDRNSLVLPNVIFPDGPSNDNRYFIVQALIDCPDDYGPKPTKLTVFNRWGDLVYRNDAYINDWAGTNTQGQPLPTGTYYYLLDLGSVSAPIKGYVVIMR